MTVSNKSSNGKAKSREKKSSYTEKDIKSLDWKEHIRLRPGMYIGKLGDGSSSDDGIYVLVKEVVDNSIDEFIMGEGDRIEIQIRDKSVTVRDYGRGIPFGKVVDCVSKINTGGKYDSAAFKKSIGLNGVGTKAVNSLSSDFTVISYRDGKKKEALFSRGELIKEKRPSKSDKKTKNGTLIEFTPDDDIFKGYNFRKEHLSELLWNYVYLNSGLSIHCNDEVYESKNGLLDLLNRKTQDITTSYPAIHLKEHDIEVSITHCQAQKEDYYSFVNGQYTTMGGTHQMAFRSAIVKAVRKFYNKDFDAQDVRTGIVAAISVRIEDPVFESQTKTKLGSTTIAKGQKTTINTWMNEFIGVHFDNYLHENPDVAEALLKRILQSERERKDLAGIKKIATEKIKKANFFNKKLRDCKIHFNTKKKGRDKTTLFITEGDSASGSITMVRDPNYQAVFSLKGKPLNSYGLKKKIVFENDEFNFLQHAINIEGGIDEIKYNRIVIATDADVDGMHIRLLLLTFFLQFYPDVIDEGHLFILETPLFRVRNKKITRYAYSEKERDDYLKKMGAGSEVVRFKGLGEISPEEFEGFIGEDMRVSQVSDTKRLDIPNILKFYMGKNSPERHDYVIENIRSDNHD